MSEHGKLHELMTIGKVNLKLHVSGPAAAVVAQLDHKRSAEHCTSTSEMLSLVLDATT